MEVAEEHKAAQKRQQQTLHVHEASFVWENYAPAKRLVSEAGHPTSCHNLSKTIHTPPALSGTRKSERTKGVNAPLFKREQKI